MIIINYDYYCYLVNLVDVILLLSLSLSRPSWTLHIFRIGINRARFWNIAQQVKSMVSDEALRGFLQQHHCRLPLFTSRAAHHGCAVRLHVSNVAFVCDIELVQSCTPLLMMVQASDGLLAAGRIMKDPFEILQSSCLHIHCNPYTK